MSITVRASMAFVIMAVSFLYFNYFRLLSISFTVAHTIYFGLICLCLATAFLSKRRDITLGILYGLSLLLISLLVIFIFFSEKL